MDLAGRDETFVAFSNEVDRLHRAWVHYQVLFEPDALRAVDPEQLAEVQRVLWILIWPVLRCIATDVCRLTDPAETRLNSNLTVERIQKDWETELKEHPPSAKFITETAADTDRLAGYTGGLRALRNKVLSHADLETALGNCPTPSALVSDLHRAVLQLVRFRDLVAGVKEGRPIDPDSASAVHSVESKHRWQNEARVLLDTLLEGVKGRERVARAEWKSDN